MLNITDVQLSILKLSSQDIDRRYSYHKEVSKFSLNNREQAQGPV